MGGPYEGPMLLDSVALENGEINFLNPSERLGNIVGNKHLFIYFDSENNAWLYGKDILKVSPQFREQHISAEQGLQSATLTDLFIDKEGTPWIATHGNGIIKIPNTNTEVLNKLDQRTIAISAIANQNDTIWFFLCCCIIASIAFQITNSRYFLCQTEIMLPIII